MCNTVAKGIEEVAQKSAEEIMEVESEGRSVHTRNAKPVKTELFLCARGSNCSNQKTHSWCLHSCVVLTDSSAGWRQNTPDQMEINRKGQELKKRSWMLKRRKYVQQWRDSQGQGI
jgi:hypothetical protein